MTTFMEDAIDVANLDPTEPVVAVYGDGLYATTLAVVRARCPSSVIVWITVLADPRFNAYDCETGNGTPADAVTYAQGRIALGYTPIVYCGEHTWWTAIEALMVQANIGGKVIYWVASYDDIQSIPSGADAKQYADPGPVDLSVVDDTFLAAIGAAPTPTPVPTPTEEEMAEVKAVVMPNGDMHTFYVNFVGALVHHEYNTSADTGWPYDDPLTGCQANDTPGVVAGAEGDPQRIDVFVRAAQGGPRDGGQLHCYYAKTKPGTYAWGWDTE